ncbi:unnamed protein product [Closterium sp. NIES-65]|nr:unnamed protein product [Closterium sp. NIES-65]
MGTHVLVALATAKASTLHGSTPTSTTTAATPTAAAIAASTSTAATFAPTPASTPTSTPTPSTSSPAVPSTTLAPPALAVAAPSPTRSRRSPDRLGANEVDGSSRSNRGQKGNERAPLKERGARVAARRSYSDYASLSSKEALLEQVDVELTTLANAARSGNKHGSMRRLRAAEAGEE